MINWKKITLKIVHVIISMTKKIEDSDVDNILIIKKSCQNILFYNTSYKNWLLQNRWALGLTK